MIVFVNCYRVVESGLPRMTFKSCDFPGHDSGGFSPGCRVCERPFFFSRTGVESHCIKPKHPHDVLHDENSLTSYAEEKR
jgi:hypothetical protein